MEEIQAISIADDGDNIAIGVPFTKINQKERTVEGFATLDNIDKADDVVDINASIEAFKSWMGNIREMHGPKAVGKAVTIEERTLEHNGRTYRGIWVKSRISKGAPDTWEKVLDGTLAGYSIGGRVLERVPEVVKADDGRYSSRRINRITKYLLAELSLVDNPMNPLSLLDGISKMMLIKMDNGEMVAGEAILENKGIFYCGQCQTAKMDDIGFNSVECPTCDLQAEKIGEANEAPSSEGLSKMVADYAMVKAYGAPASGGGASSNSAPPKPHTFKAGPDGKCVICGQASGAPIHQAAEKVLNYNYEESTGESGFGVDGEWKPNPELIDPKPELLTNVAEATPQTDDAAPQVKADSAQAVQTAEGTVKIDVNLLASDIAEALKSHGKFFGRSTKEKSPEEEFIRGLLDTDILKTTEEFNTKAAAVRFNFPGQRAENGYSMTEWAELGRKIADNLGEGNSYQKGVIVGPGITQVDTEKGELIFNLQKNATNDNNSIVKLLQNLVGYIQDSDSSITKGGETQTLDAKELGKILDILETATREVGDVLKGFNVERLNSEAGTGVTLGGSAGDPGVGTGGSAEAGSTMTAGEVEVAKPTSMPTPDNGPEKVTPDAIATDGTAIGQGITADSGPEKVLPHAELGKADEPVVEETPAAEDLMKAFMDRLEGKFDEFSTRLETVEHAGGGKKSGEVVTDINKSDTTDSVWSGTFYSGELKNN